MITCPTCGALNEPVNRFCEQCGARLEPGSPVPSGAVPPPVAASHTCPNCGVPVLPGQAFCEECGIALTAAPPASVSAPPVSVDAPTIMTPPPARPVAGSICPSCGHQTMPGDRFCDACGAALTPAPSPSIADVPTAAAPEPPWAAPAPHMPVEPATPTLIAAAPPPIPPVIPVEQPMPSASETVVSPPVAPVADAQAEYEAKRQALLDEIARQDQIIAQLEQMRATFGAATPHAITLALDEAREARAKAQANLDALQPPPPPVDPAVVAALNDEIARQQQIIAQLEQMQATFGAATPHAIALALAEAHDALAKAQTELAALGVAPLAPTASASAAPPPAPVIAEPVAPPVEPAAPSPFAAPPEPAAPSPFAAPPVEPAAPSPFAMPPVEPVASSPFAAPPVSDTAVTVTSPPEALPSAATVLAPPAGPRLVFDSGQEISVPIDKTEITIGREDPISGIHPEIDLTPFGGESGGVSRQHARLIYKGGQWSIVDLGSTNYTRVDGLRIEPGAPHPLKDGARLQFGRLTVTFRA